MTKTFGIIHTTSGKWLHIRKFDDKGLPLLTDDLSESWVSFKEQAVAQASFLLPDGEWGVVEFSGLKGEKS